MDKIIDRVLAQSGDRELLDKLMALPAPDLNTLLLRLFQLRVQGTEPKNLLKAYEGNRFCPPSEADPGRYHALEASWLTLARQHGIEGLLLSPAAPLGSSAAFGCVNQNNVVSALRGTEILPDPSNMLAIHIAEGLGRGTLNNRTPLHRCTTARVLRAQAFPRIKGFYPHFGIFSIVSSGKDTGSYSCESALLRHQLAFYRELFVTGYGATLSVVLRRRGGYTDGEGFFDRMAALFEEALPDIPLTLETGDEDNAYYKGINFKMYMEHGGERTEVGDGGFVDWIQQMTGNKKERCLITGVGLDRFLLMDLCDTGL